VVNAMGTLTADIEAAAVGSNEIPGSRQRKERRFIQCTLLADLTIGGSVAGSYFRNPWFGSYLKRYNLLCAMATRI